MKILCSGGILLAAMIWGLSFVVVKSSVDSIPVLYLLAMRHSIAALALALPFARRMARIGKVQAIRGAVLGVIIFAGQYFQVLGAKYTTAGENAFLTCTYVVVVPLLCWLLFRQRPARQCFTASLLAVLGIGLLSLQGDLTINPGDALTLLSSVGLGLHIIYIDRFIGEGDPIVLAAVQFGCAGLLPWLLALLLRIPFPAGVFQWDTAKNVLYIGLFGTMAAFVFQMACQKHIAPNVAAVLLSMEAVFGMLFSVLFAGEAVMPRILAGCAVMFTAILTAELDFSQLVQRKSSGLQ